MQNSLYDNIIYRITGNLRIRGYDIKERRKTLYESTDNKCCMWIWEHRKNSI